MEAKPGGPWMGGESNTAYAHRFMVGPFFKQMNEPAGDFYRRRGGDSLFGKRRSFSPHFVVLTAPAR